MELSKPTSQMLAPVPPKTYRKHYIPLESNPQLFTELIHNLGVSSSFRFEDVLSTDEPDLLALIPRPAHALILVFPATESYEDELALASAGTGEYTGGAENVIWFKQTIHNACGLYGILHAVCNGEVRKHIDPDSILAKLSRSCLDLPPEEAALVLENSPELEATYKTIAVRGDSAVPEDPEGEVDFHYICFVKSPKNGHMYLLDGDWKGPVDKGKVLKDGEDILGEGALAIVRGFLQREGGDGGFGLLALVGSAE